MTDAKHDSGLSASPGPVSDPPAAPPSRLDADLEREIAEALAGQSVEQLMEQAAAAQAPPPAPPPDAADAAPKRRPAAEIPHDMVRGRIAAIQGDDVFVELIGLGGKNQGLVPLTQFERPPRPGSIMDFVVVREDEDEGLVHLSREGAISRATWEQLQKGAVVEARVLATNKGGLELEMVGGIQAFMPASQIDLYHVDDLRQFVGQKLPAVVQEIDRRSRRVILSRREHLEQERRRKTEQLFAEIQPEQFREGVVRRLAEFGAFVDLGGVDGLIHISDLSYSRVANAADILQVGQTVRVKVLKVDAERGRISLGLKQVAPDPWDGVEARIKVGEQISGKVTRVADFGAFVELAPGIEGLLPGSELSWRRNQRVGDLVKEGDVLRVAVLAVDPAKRRLTLSLKQITGNPWTGAAQKYPRNAMAEGTVLSTAEFGAFVELEAGLEGLVHISELSDKRVNAVTDVLKVGDKHSFRVLEVDEENRRIRLSLKAARQAPEAPPPPAAADPAKPARAAKKRPENLKGGIAADRAVLGIGLGQLKL